MGISKEDIVLASIRILNRSGIGGLSMRAIARELGIKAASLYNHISGKLELYSNIIEHMCADFAEPDAALSPKEYLAATAVAYRAMVLTVRDAVVIFEDSFPTTPRWIAISKAVTGCLLQFGVRAENLLTVGSLYNNYILSFIRDETREQSWTPDERQLSEENLGIGALLSSHVGKFDEQFLYGIRVLLEGIERVENGAAM